MTLTKIQGLKMTALKSTHECPLRVKVFSGLAAPGKFSVVSSSLLQPQATVKKFILVLRQDRDQGAQKLKIKDS